MKWYYAEDIFYYRKEEQERLSLSGDLLVAPSEEEVLDALRASRRFNVIAPYLPPQKLKPLFTLVELPNRAPPFTSQEMQHIMFYRDPARREFIRAKLLQQKLGLRVYTDLDGIHLIGLDNVRRYISAVKGVKDEKLRPKGVFLVGVPGTGKSYSAKYCAKVLGGYLVEFNISQILESPNPVFTLHNVFNFLSSMDKPVVLWIDEIEKAFIGHENEKRVFGQLLTILSDLNSPTGYRLNGLVWATANNIVDIMNRNPEFLRRGRFDELFFVDNPKISNAKKIADHYKKVYGFDYPEDFGEALVRVVREIVYVRQTNMSGSASANRFLYTPAEIEQVAKQMAIRQRMKEAGAQMELLYPEETVKTYSIKPLEKGLDESDLVVAVSQISPISVSMQESIDVMRGQAELFTPAD